MSRLFALIAISVLTSLLLTCSCSVNAEITTTTVITITTVVAERTLLIHDVFYVGARDFTRYDFEACSGCEVSIVFYVYEAATQTVSDIIFRVLAPDGREVYPRTKVSRGLYWSFIAEQGGRYILEFDNTYSLLTTKRVDLAIAITPPPTTVREIMTIYRTTTVYTTTTITSIATTTITPSGLGLIPEPGLTALVGVVALIIGLVVGMFIRRPKPSTKA